MIGLLFMADVIAAAPDPVKGRTKITMRVVRGEKITAEEWQKSPRRSERVIVDENGRKLLVRIIDHE